MRAQVGNSFGVAQAAQADGKIADCVADAANGFTVAAADIRKFYPGQRIDMRTRSNGVSVMQDRRVTAVARATNTVSYDGADATASALEGIYSAETAGTVYEGSPGINGGASSMSPAFDGDGPSVAFLRAELQLADSATYTDAYMDVMTFNDLVYAYRILRNAGSGKL